MGSQVFERGLGPIHHVDFEGILPGSQTRTSWRTIPTPTVPFRQTGHTSLEFVGELPVFSMLIFDLVGPLGPLGDLGGVPIELVPMATKTILIPGQDLVEVVVSLYSGIVHLLHGPPKLIHLVLHISHCSRGRLPQLEQ